MTKNLYHNDVPMDLENNWKHNDLRKEERK